jgi:hypothetical protein
LELLEREPLLALRVLPPRPLALRAPPRLELALRLRLLREPLDWDDLAMCISCGWSRGCPPRTEPSSGSNGRGYRGGFAQSITTAAPATIGRRAAGRMRNFPAGLPRTRRHPAILKIDSAANGGLDLARLA